MNSFRTRKTKDERLAEASSIISRYKDHIPAIIEPRGLDTPILLKQKFLIPRDLTSNQLVHLLAKRCKRELLQTETLILVCNGRILTGGQLLGAVYATHKDQTDSFLYISYAREHVFG
jgi:hypothetical protein